jgi:hypothetical protein
MEGSVAVNKAVDKSTPKKLGGIEARTLASHLSKYSRQKVLDFCKNIPHEKDPVNNCKRTPYNPELCEQLTAAKQPTPTLSKEVISKKVEEEAKLLATKAAQLVLGGVTIPAGVPHLFVAAFLAKVISSNSKNLGKLALNEQRVLAGGKTR